MKTRTNILSRIAHDQRGNVGIMFGLMVIPAFMFVGGAIDFGNAYKTKQKIQAAADAGVLAAVGMGHDATSQARKTMAETIFNANLNGVTGVTGVATVNGNTVTINATGTHNTAFLKLAHLDRLNVGGSASGTVDYTSSSSTTTTSGTTNGQVCLLALDPSNAINGIKSQGTPNVKYLDCYAHTNSTAASSNNPNEGALVGGGSAIVEGAGHFAVGGIGSNATGVYSPAPVGGKTAIADPFATNAGGAYSGTYATTFSTPSIPNACTATGLNLKQGTYTLSPGRYCNGLTLQAQATVTLEEGEYIIENGQFTVQSGASVSGTNVLFYFRQTGTQNKDKTYFTVIGGGTVNLKGRTSGTDSRKGFLFIMHPNANMDGTSNIQGGGTFNMEGMIYAPRQNIVITGNGDANANSNMFALVAKSFEFEGNGIFRMKPWNSASNLNNIVPTTPVPTTTTTTTTTNVVDRVKLN